MLKETKVAAYLSCLKANSFKTRASQMCFVCVLSDSTDCPELSPINTKRLVIKDVSLIDSLTLLLPGANTDRTDRRKQARSSSHQKS